MSTHPTSVLIRLGTVYHSILREIGFKKNPQGCADGVCPPERMGWSRFRKKLSWSRENEVWLALSVREE